MANRDPESRGGTKNRGNSSYPPAYYSSGYHVESTETQQWSSWLVPLIVVANVAMFFVIMYVNDCPKNNSGSRGNCVAKFLGRLSYQPLKENPIFGSSSSVEGEKLDAGTETNANLDHQLYYHFLGTAQSEDILCWRDADNPKHTFIASVTEDGKRITEQAGVVLTLDLKPIDGDWNGAGCHTNYSTKSMREEGGFEVIKKTILNLSLRHKEHISAYGEGNEIILTGKHETASINTFSWVHAIDSTPN